jgi:CO dehydrogenase/acetyl-CoA synthase gamma subunit (corrinoid Fe-S protein)
MLYMSDCCCGNGWCCSGGVSAISTSLSLKDILGAWKIRWGIGRDNCKVDPGLYAIGKPDSTSPVLVSANYKLTFDTVRKNLNAFDCWLLILDTKGVNVWCAAGKGTFSTDEL